MHKKSYSSLEKVFKGVANHRRIQMMDALHEKPELSLGEIADQLSIDYRTASEHLRKLTLAGLVMKRYEGNIVRHALTDRGKSILKFCRILE